MKFNGIQNYAHSIHIELVNQNASLGSCSRCL